MPDGVDVGSALIAEWAVGQDARRHALDDWVWAWGLRRGYRAINLLSPVAPKR